MPRFAWFLAFVLLMFINASQANAAPQLKIEPALPESIWASPSNVCGGFATDELTLRLSDHGKQLASKVFCSSYGRATAHMVTDNAKHTFILLEYSNGRGTNATTNYLELDRLQSKLLEVLRVPLSWGIGLTARFTYSYLIELPASGGISIRLNGRIVGQPDPKFDCCVPHATNLTISVSPGS